MTRAERLPWILRSLSRSLSSALWSRCLARVGTGLRIEPGARIIGGACISIGRDFSAGKDLWLAAVQNYEGVDHQPSMKIGDRFNCGDAVHIACIGQITIGNDVLIGSRVHITDHSHGNYRSEGAPQNRDQPIRRPLYSAGSVVIGRNVWICDGAVITAGIHIGEGAVIGANSVVTKSVAPFSMVGGNPARLLKRLDPAINRWRSDADLP